MKNASAQRKGKSCVKKVFLYMKVALCLCIICTAVYLKHSETPVLDEITQTVNQNLKVDEAIAVIGNDRDAGETMEVFEKKDEDKTEEVGQIFDCDFYVDGEGEEVKRAAEEEKRRREEEEKKLSIETLSFSMSPEELFDDTKAEPFRIPPPSSCSYEKISINFKYNSPLYGTVTSRFGYRDHPIMDDSNFHTGIDIAAKSGSPITAFADGTVIDSGKNDTYGNYILIEHSDGIRSFYGHNSKLVVKKGEKVKLGQKIAEVGSTGMSTGPHLHFEIRNGKIRLDPSLYISPESV